MSDEWVHLTPEQVGADPSLVGAISRFRAPDTPAGRAAETWLKTRALLEARHTATYVLLRDGEAVAFYSLGPCDLELRQSHRKSLGAENPTQSGVLVKWMARDANADVGADLILKHAVGIGQVAANIIGAAVIALDPYDEGVEQMWRERFGFRSSRTKAPNGLTRLWAPLFPDGA